MPPTTELKVRPGLKRIARLYGSIKGIYSYNTGATVVHAQHWYQQTIKYGQRQVLMLKMSQNDGNSIIYSFNPLNNQFDKVASINDSTYSKDYALHMHSIMFTSGNNSSPMYIWNSRVGFKKMAWHTEGSSYQEISNLENITFFNGYVFANVYNTFNIYVMPIENIDPDKQDSWDNLWSFFTPKIATELSIDGYATLGGSIMKLFSLTKTGLDTMADYLCVCTNMGEIILIEGPTVTTSGTPPTNKYAWKFCGRFRIPVPLNKDAFCKMEGDVIVATKNGLYSLMRVIFGQQSQITESLEYRIKNIFDDYMFTMPVFSQQIKLFYNQKNRLLILNLPTSMPISFNTIKKGYEFTSEQYIVLPETSTVSDEVKEQIRQFIFNYLYQNQLDYRITLQFNDSETEGIFIEFSTSAMTSKQTSKTSATTTIDFYIIINGHKTSFLAKPIEYYTSDMTDISQLHNRTGLLWNPALLTEYMSLKYYAFKFPEDGGKTWAVTNMFPSVNHFSKMIQWPSIQYSTSNTQVLDGITQLLYSPRIKNERWPLTYNPNIMEVLNEIDFPPGETYDVYNAWQTFLLNHPEIPTGVDLWQHTLTNILVGGIDMMQTVYDPNTHQYSITGTYIASFNISNTPPVLGQPPITHNVMFKIKLDGHNIEQYLNKGMKSGYFQLDAKNSGLWIDYTKIIELSNTELHLEIHDNVGHLMVASYHNKWRITPISKYADQFIIDYIDTTWKITDFSVNIIGAQTLFGGFFVSPSITTENLPTFLASECFPMSLVQFSDLPIADNPLPPPPQPLWLSIDISAKFNVGEFLFDSIGFYTYAFNFRELLHHPISTEGSIPELVKKFILNHPYFDDFKPQEETIYVEYPPYIISRKYINIIEFLLNSLRGIAAEIEKEVFTHEIGFDFKCTYSTSILFKSEDTNETIGYHANYDFNFAINLSDIVNSKWIVECFYSIIEDETGHYIYKTNTPLILFVGADFRSLALMQDAQGVFTASRLQTKKGGTNWKTQRMLAEFTSPFTIVNSKCNFDFHTGDVRGDENRANWFYFGGWVFTAIDVDIMSTVTPAPVEFEWADYIPLSELALPQALSWYVQDHQAVRAYNRNLPLSAGNFESTYLYYFNNMIGNYIVGWQDFLKASITSTFPPTGEYWDNMDLRFSKHDPISPFHNIVREYLYYLTGDISETAENKKSIDLTEITISNVYPKEVDGLIVYATASVKLSYTCQLIPQSNPPQAVIWMKLSKSSDEPDGNQTFVETTITYDLRKYEAYVYDYTLNNFSYNPQGTPNIVYMGDLLNLSMFEIKRSYFGDLPSPTHPLYILMSPMSFDVEHSIFYRKYYGWMFSFINYLNSEKPEPYPPIDPGPTPEPPAPSQLKLLKNSYVDYISDNLQDYIRLDLWAEHMVSFLSDNISKTWGQFLEENAYALQFSTSTVYQPIMPVIYEAIKISGIDDNTGSLAWVKWNFKSPDNPLTIAIDHDVELDGFYGDTSADLSKYTNKFKVTIGVKMYWVEDVGVMRWGHYSPFIILKYVNSAGETQTIFDDESNCFSDTAAQMSPNANDPNPINKPMTGIATFASRILRTAHYNYYQISKRTMTFWSNNWNVNYELQRPDNVFRLYAKDQVTIPDFSIVNDYYSGSILSAFTIDYRDIRTKKEKKKGIKKNGKERRINSSDVAEIQAAAKENIGDVKTVQQSAEMSVAEVSIAKNTQENIVREPTIVGAEPPVFAAVQNTNFDLALVPLFSNINILAPLRSTQFVMDSYYGTWSQWQDINMIDGIDHLDEFYMVIPDDYQPSIQFNNFVYNESSLVKFDPNANGDYENWLDPTQTKPIKVSYKTSPTNFNIPNLKQINNVSLFGTSSTFWGVTSNTLGITLFTDFVENPTYYYQHAMNTAEIQLKILYKMGLDKSFLRADFSGDVRGISSLIDFKKMTYSQRQKYQKLYLEESAIIKNIVINTVNKIGSRVQLEMKMNVYEHNIVIYGYEVFLKVLNKF
jgi:hypothetical protein